MNGESAIAPRRVHVVGGPASGKTTMASHIAERLGLPVHHLDDLHRADGGVTLRPVEHRLRMVRAILDTDGWVTEGIHLGWTDPFFDRADLVAWIDTPGWVKASARILRRSGAGSATVAPAPNESASKSVGRRLRHALFQTRAVVDEVREVRHYHLYPRGTSTLPETRTATRDRLDGHVGHLMHCRSEKDLAEFLLSLPTVD